MGSTGYYFNFSVQHTLARLPPSKKGSRCFQGLGNTESKPSYGTKRFYSNQVVWDNHEVPDFSSTYKNVLSVAGLMSKGQVHTEQRPDGGCCNMLRVTWRKFPDLQGIQPACHTEEAAMETNFKQSLPGSCFVHTSPLSICLKWTWCINSWQNSLWNRSHALGNLYSGLCLKGNSKTFPPPSNGQVSLALHVPCARNMAAD